MSTVEVGAEPLPRLAVLLSTRPAELVAAVRLQAGRDLDVVVDSPARLRALVVPIFLRERGPVPAPDPVEGLAPELTEVVARIGGLHRFERTVLVLVAVEHLTRAEVAGLVDRSVGTVDQAYERALAATGAEPWEIVTACSALVARGVEPGEIRRVEQQLTRRRRSRSRRRGLLVAAAVLVVSGVLSVPGLVRQAAVEPTWVRAPGEWVQSLQLASTSGWTVESRTVRADVELTELTAAGGPGRCQVVVDQRVSAGGVTGDRSVRVEGRPGKITAGPDRATLSWTVGPGAIAAVTCMGMADPARTATDLAEQLVFAAEPIRLAYRIATLPPRFHVDQIKIRPPQGVTVVELWPDEDAQSSPPISVRQSVGGTSGTEPPELDAAEAEVTLTCRLANAISVCASAAGPGAVDSPAEQTRINRRLRQIVDGATLAPNGVDPTTWFDARDALPRT